MATSTPYDTDPTVITTADKARPRVSWGAIIAAVFIALALQILFGMLGIGIGAVTIDPVQADGTPGASAFGIGAAIWWVATSIISMFAAGWVAGHLAGAPRRSDSMLHGLATWALATVLMVYLVSSAAGSLFSGIANALGGVASVSAQGVAAAAPNLAETAKQAVQGTDFSWDAIKEEAQALLAQTGKPDLQPGAIEQDASNAVKAMASGDQDIGAMLDRLFAEGKDAASQVDRDAIINVLMQRTDMSREEAAKQLQNWENTYEQLKQEYEEAKQRALAEARQAAAAAADAIAQASLLAFVASILGALAAMFGAAGSASRNRAYVAH